MSKPTVHFFLRVEVHKFRRKRVVERVGRGGKPVPDARQAKHLAHLVEKMQRQRQSPGERVQGRRRQQVRLAQSLSRQPVRRRNLIGVNPYVEFPVLLHEPREAGEAARRIRRVVNHSFAPYQIKRWGGKWWA